MHRQMNCKSCPLLLLILIHFSGFTQEFIPVWPDGLKPNSNGLPVTDSVHNERIWRVATPGIYAFRVPAAENNGSAVLICPGGGYERISHIYNGFQFARWFNARGINAFVLIYRLPQQRDLTDHQLAPLQDAQRAIRLIRANAGNWLIDSSKIGVMGISAGGHVATMLGTRAEDVSAINDTISRSFYRPDYMILLSPVVTMGKWAHAGSKRNFLGADTSKVMIEKYSGEEQVSEWTPPAFIVHAQNDKSVNVRNSLQLYAHLAAHNIPSSLHVFPQGGHGIRLTANPGSTDQWLSLLEAWMRETGFVTPLPFK